MDKRTVQYFRQKLTDEQRRLQEQIREIDGTGLAAELRDSVSELSAYDNHPADLGSETFERSKDLALKDNAEIILSEVTEALQQIDSGTYGYCQECGQPISRERLEAIPYTMLCLKCKERAETGHHPSRPIEEELLSPPFGRTFLDDADYTGFDGEDAWQAVALYGTAESPQDIPGAVSFDNLYVGGDELRGYVSEIEQYDNDALLPGTTDGPKRLSLWSLSGQRWEKVKQKLRQSKTR